MSSVQPLKMVLQNLWATSEPVYAFIINTTQSVDAKGNVQPLDAAHPPQAILLGAQESSTTVTINAPTFASARVYFSIDAQLKFGPDSKTQPSPVNVSDPNYNTIWQFCEFDWTSPKLVVNPTSVDLFAIPISIDVEDSFGHKTVPGISANSIWSIENALTSQTSQDGQPWKDLMIKDKSGKLLRILSPNSYIATDPSKNHFGGYFERLVNQAFLTYGEANPLTINTQGQWGDVKGFARGDRLVFPSGTIQKPSTADIFACGTTNAGNGGGAFAPTGDAELNNIMARIGAALNRGTLLDSPNQPNGVDEKKYYSDAGVPMNHYARIMHQNTIGAVGQIGIGYAFPYDDVHPEGAPDLSGTTISDTVKSLTIAVGGNQALLPKPSS